MRDEHAPVLLECRRRGTRASVLRRVLLPGGVYVAAIVRRLVVRLLRFLRRRRDRGVELHVVVVLDRAQHAQATGLIHDEVERSRGGVRRDTHGLQNVRADAVGRQLRAVVSGQELLNHPRLKKRLPHGRDVVALFPRRDDATTEVSERNLRHRRAAVGKPVGNCGSA
ncbi:MAG: hypothetical protein M3R46_08455 [Actinomycetota bacterium]|nr:hypothetical protein [Actinomycetota bacterium]